jgi:hypothetical protein
MVCKVQNRLQSDGRNIDCQVKEVGICSVGDMEATKFSVYRQRSNMVSSVTIRSVMRTIPCSSTVKDEVRKTEMLGDEKCMRPELGKSLWKWKG